VDVALEKDGLSVACEISVTTTPEHEVSNLQKCLAAGFTYVVQIATDRKSLTALAASAKNLRVADPERLQFLLPEELFAFLEEQDVAAKSDGATVRGYRVRVKYKPVSANEQKAKKKVIAGTIMEAMRRLKRKS
jgi:hypothetical protein